MLEEFDSKRNGKIDLKTKKNESTHSIHCLLFTKKPFLVPLSIECAGCRSKLFAHYSSSLLADIASIDIIFQMV